MKALTMAAICTATLSGATWAEGDAAKGRDLARPNCARCHGADGNARTTSFQPVPMLAGQPAVYLLQEMRNYASGARPDGSEGASMSRILKTLSDQDLEDLAAFYEAQPRY